MNGAAASKIADVVAGLTARYREIESAFEDPSFASSPQYASKMKEWRRLQRIVEPGARWLAARDRVKEDESILADPKADAELAQIAAADLEEARSEERDLFEKVRGLLVTDEPLAERDVVMEIRAGTGGEEACLFAADLFRMYQRYGESRGWRTEILTGHQTDLGGFKEVIVGFEGDGVFKRLRFESGGHRVQRVPETEAGGRIHTSACTVAVLPEPEEVEIALKPDDLKVETFRASGPGGQKVNKTSSAVRMTHLLTGIVVSCQDEKSQHKNRAKALKIMKSRLFEHEQSRLDNERSRERRTQIGSGDRSDRVRTYNFPQNRMTDHRIKTNFSLDRVMAGELDGVIDALDEAFRAQRLSQLENSRP